MEYVLPEELTEIKETDPKDLILISPPKLGKTTILAELTKERKDAVLLNLQKGGTDYVKGRFIQIHENDQTNLKEACDNYIKARDMLRKNRGHYKYLIVDNLTCLDEMSELMGTYLFMATPQGKSWNKDPKTQKEYQWDDPNFKMITTMGEGYGYRYTRDWFLKQIEIFREIADYRIFAAHIKDKLIKNNQDETIAGTELNVTGKLKNILAADISTMAKLVGDGNERYLSFEVSNENFIAGSRAPRLEGKILISEKTKDGIKTYWDSIYPQKSK